MPATPLWLPSGAIIHADFVSGHYYGGGDERTKESLFYATASFGSWDPETSITAAGLVQARPGINQAFIADLLANGFSAVFEADFGDGVSNNKIIMFDDPQQNFQAGADFFDAASGLADVAYWADFENSVGSPPGVNTGDGLHKCGFTITPTGFYFTRDGQAGYASDPFAWISPAPDSIAVYANTGAIKNVTFYAPMANAALQALTA